VEIALLTLLLIKHAFADLFLQTLSSGTDKTKYFGNGHRHYAEHGAGTLIICLFFVNPILASLISILDYLIHWHVDFCKTHFVKRMKIEHGSASWFRIQTFDQIAHYLTYALIVLLVQQSYV
jgi:hypothetical protein